MVDRFWKELAKSDMNPYVLRVLHGSENYNFGITYWADCTVVSASNLDQCEIRRNSAQTYTEYNQPNILLVNQMAKCIRFACVLFGDIPLKVFKFPHLAEASAPISLLPSSSLQVRSSTPGQRLRISCAQEGTMIVRTEGKVCPSKAVLIAVVIWEWAWTTWIVWRFGRTARQFANAGRIVDVL
jgi:hypothetical protein